MLAFAQNSVQSPSGDIELSLSAEGGALSYTVSFHGRPVILKSALGLEIEDQPALGTGVRITGARRGAIDETYNMLHGKSNPVRNVARTLAVDVEETHAPLRRFSMEARAYDDGVAFRYVLPNQSPLPALRLTAERTEFQLAKDATTYPLLLESFQTPYEDGYHIMPLSGIHKDSLIGLPLLAELPGVAWVAITEADIENYSGMYLMHNGHDPRSLVSRLAPSIDEPGICVTAATPARSPWRVLMIADQPGRLIESNIVINLNPPPAIADTSWIKPGKTAWDWWSGTWADRRRFPARHEYRDHEPLHRFRLGFRLGIHADRRRLERPRHRPQRFRRRPHPHTDRDRHARHPGARQRQERARVAVGPLDGHFAADGRSLPAV